MYCPNCGKEVPDGNRFCTGCGSIVPAVPDASAPVTVEARFTSAFSSAETVAFEKPSEQDIADTISGAHDARAQEQAWTPPPAESFYAQPQTQPDPPQPRQENAAPVTEAGLYYANIPGNTAWAPLPPVDASVRARLRPMSLGEVFDRGLGIFRSNFLEFVKLSAIVIIPVYVLNLISKIEQMKFLEWIGIAVSILLGIAVNGAIIKSASDSYLGANVSSRYSLSFALRKSFPLFIGALFYIVVTAASAVLLVIPGLIVMIMYYFFANVIVIENRSGGRSLTRSGYLVQGHWWSAFAVIFFGSAFLYVPIISISIISEIAGGLSSSIAGSIINQSLMSLITLFITPILPIISTVFYYNLRIRRDGLDIELACEEIWT